MTRLARYVITVNRDGIDKGDPRPILVEDPSGAKTRARRVVLGPNSVMEFGPPRRDGARVWVETDDVIIE